MKLRSQMVTVTSALVMIAGPVAAANVPTEWDGLRRVASKRLDAVYLQPGADFRGYSKVLVEDTEVAFHKSWQRDYNSSTRGVSQRVSDNDIQHAISKGVAAAGEIFDEAWTKGGYQVVKMPGADVLKVRTAVVNIFVSSPDRRTSSRSYSFSNEAGHATLIMEARDSMTGALLGRAVDQEIAGDTTVGWRTSVSNRGDFRDVVQTWARDAVRGMRVLKALSHVQ